MALVNMWHVHWQAEQRSVFDSDSVSLLLITHIYVLPGKKSQQPAPGYSLRGQDMLRTPEGADHPHCQTPELVATPSPGAAN